MHTSCMRFRGILAGLLTALLLSLSTNASVCQVRCGLGSIAPSCHTAAPHPQNHDTMPPMEGMDGMPHQDGARSSAETKAVLLANSACTTHVCSQLPAKVSELKALSHTLVSVAAVSHTTLQFPPEPSRTNLAPRGPPDLRQTTPVSLRTTLRV